MLQETSGQEKCVVLATHNMGKVGEIEPLLQCLNMRVVLQSKMNVSLVEESGFTFLENAIIKARNASKQTGLPAIADDSGLIVNSLNGLPGIYSARFAGENATDHENLDKLISLIGPLTDKERKAHFVCSMVYLRHESDPMPLIAEGVWEGQLSPNPKGTQGFGYDPIFYVPSQQCTAAELSAEMKNKLSHRGIALKKLVRQLSLSNIA